MFYNQVKETDKSIIVKLLSGFKTNKDGVTTPVYKTSIFSKDLYSIGEINQFYRVSKKSSENSIKYCVILEFPKSDTIYLKCINK